MFNHHKYHNYIINWLSVLICGAMLFIYSGFANASSVPPANQSASLMAQAATGVWEVVTSPTTNNLWSASFSSPTSGWAGGSNILLRYNGSDWQAFSAPALGTEYMVDAISMISDTDGWLVGRRKKVTLTTRLSSYVGTALNGMRFRPRLHLP